MRSIDASWPTKHHRQQQSGHCGPELGSDGAHAMHGVHREPGHYGPEDAAHRSACACQHPLSDSSEYIRTYVRTYTYIQLHTVTYSYVQLRTVTYSYIQLHTVTYSYIHTYVLKT